MKEATGALKGKSTSGGFFTGQGAKASSNTFYPKNQASQEKLSDDTPDYKKITETFRTIATPKML